MKVLYDHQTFTGSQYGGIPRYFYELMNAFSSRDDIQFELSLKFSNNEYLRDVEYANPIRFESFTNIQHVSLRKRECMGTCKSLIGEIITKMYDLDFLRLNIEIRQNAPFGSF